MATQTLEFSAGTGLTLSCKLFALGSDTVVDTQTATEKTNDKNRYSVAFTDIAAGAYRLNAFVGATGGFANEVYDLTLSTATFYPREEAAATGLDAAGVRAAVGLASANLDTQLSGINAKTQLITTGTVFVTVDRVAGSTITMHYNESTTATVPLDEDTTSLTLRFIVENSDQLDVLVIENANITRTASNFTATITTAVTATLGQYRWALRDITGGINRLIEGGVLQVISAANKDA
jgi:redox-regulated HSP33 family molecular chaperone